MWLNLQYEQLSEALAACGRDDILGFIYDIKQKFEPGTKCAVSRSTLNVLSLTEIDQQKWSWRLCIWSSTMKR